MKTIFIFAVLIGTTFCVSAQLVTNQPARLKFKVAFSEGKIDSGTGGDSICFAPENVSIGIGGQDIITSPGYEHELKWTFVGRNRDKDVYRFTFTRMTKAGSSDKITTTKEIQFNGQQVVVFEDELHTVVMESPSAEDLKSAQSH